MLKKNAKKAKHDEGDSEDDKNASTWDKRKLSVGNWFSSTMYYKIQNVNEGDIVDCKSNGEAYLISKDVIEHDMFNSEVFGREESLPLTKVVKILRDANTTVFTINFNCKVDDKEVK